jgi:hypothetical protein
LGWAGYHGHFQGRQSFDKQRSCSAPGILLAKSLLVLGQEVGIVWVWVWDGMRTGGGGAGTGEGIEDNGGVGGVLVLG